MKLNKISNLRINFINQLLKNLKKRKVYLSFKDNIWGVDLADMQLVSKYNKGIRFWLCAIDLFSKYAPFTPIKDKKGVVLANAFQKILDNSKGKPNKIWTGQGSELYNCQYKKLLKDNNIEMYSTYNERKSVVIERFIRTLKKTKFMSTWQLFQKMFILMF